MKEPENAARTGMSRTLTLTLTAMFVVLVFLFTLIGFPLALLPGSYIHLGNIPLIMAALLFDRRCAMLAGGLGMAAFDIAFGYVPWAPFTLVISALMGYLMGLLWERGATVPRYFIGITLATAIKVAGYYVADGLIYGNWIMPVTSIPANILQVLVAAAVVLPMKNTLLRATARLFSQHPIAEHKVVHSEEDTIDTKER